MITYHFLNRYNKYYTLCGIYAFTEKGIDFAVWCDYQKEWLVNEYPTCEVCILLNFQDSKSTYYCSCINCREMHIYT